MSAFRFHLIDKQSELFAYATTWHELNSASANAEPMLDPNWLLLWWRHYGAGTELAVGLLYDADALIGIAPLCIRAYRYRPGLVFRRLQFMGIDANECDGVCSEYMNFIARPGYEKAVANEFVDRINDGAFGRWHEVVLAAMSSENPMTEFVQQRLAHHGFEPQQRIVTSAYSIILPKTWEGYLRSLTSKRRWSINNSLERFKEWAGDRPWRVDHSTTPASLATAFQQLMALHSERWQQSDLSGAFASPRFTTFHRDYTTEKFASGEIDVARLVVGDEPLGLVYTIRQGSRVLIYQCGRSVGVPGNVKVGIVLHALLVQEAIARGDSEYDFLGGEADYKRKFANHVRPIVEIRIARPNVREYLRRGLVVLRDRVRKAVTAARPVTRPVAAPDVSAAAE